MPRIYLNFAVYIELWNPEVYMQPPELCKKNSTLLKAVIFAYPVRAFFLRVSNGAHK